MSSFLKHNQQVFTSSHNRLRSEFKTLTSMMYIYCEAHHGSDSVLCKHCAELLTYAGKRLESCPFQEKKPTCGKCTVHCYKKTMQDKIKTVMKYAGPRMIYRHPIMALKHLIDGSRNIPTLKKK